MRYEARGADFDRVLATSPQLRALVWRKASAGAAYWRANSRRRTGYNASHVRVLAQTRNGKRVAVIYAHGYYAKWRELGTRWNAPEAVLRRSIPAIRAAR
ncbi:hypothetical protein [Nocardia transvalensis]|uniref:hypothetical protein n=1 Tax=Nocardia transvalensis TaxID=37333 RepID=UPI0018957173|nr:hypothetical protein [Nocardia transvalensis]MBF6332378.1 hypothetical protein [Nocardia transvalensis]